MDATMFWLLLAVIPLEGVLMAMTPWLMPRGECFAVSIPESQSGDQRLFHLKGIYSVAVVSISLIGFCFLLEYSGCFESSFDDFIISYCVASFVPIAVGFAMMLACRRKVRRIKAEEGWMADAQLSSAQVLHEVVSPLSLRWNLVYIPILIFSAVLIAALYPHMPDALPMQVDASGNVARTVEKSPITASFPLILNLFFALVFTFSHWILLKSKKPVNPRKPAVSSWAYARYLNAQCVMLLVSGCCLCLAGGIFIPLSMAGILSMIQAAIAFMGVAVIIVAGCIVLAVVYGQNGARLMEKEEPSDGMPCDDDEHWKLGVFYVNGDDAAVIVPKRFGIGATMNLGNAKAWLIIVAFIAVTALFCWLCVAFF